MQLLMHYPVMFEIPDLVHNALSLRNPVSSRCTTNQPYISDVPLFPRPIPSFIVNVP